MIKMLEVINISSKLDYNADHMCPVYKRIIDPDLCYDSLMCLNRCFTVSSIPELSEVKNIKETLKICEKCI